MNFLNLKMNFCLNNFFYLLFMGGGAIFQLNVKGLQDKKLISNPQINFLKQEFKPFVNFSSVLNRLEPRENSGFSKNFTIRFKNTAELLHKLYFCFSLPPLVPTSGTFAGWTNSVGHAIIDKVEIQVAGQTIDTKYGLFMEIWDELTRQNNLDSSADKMVGKFRHIPLLQANAEIDTHYTVPLPFWFCNSLVSALPLVALYFQEVTLKVTLRDFEDCIIYDGLTPPDRVEMYNVHILAENIYLEERERLILRHSKQVQIISQTQYSLPRSVAISGYEHITLPFNHPVYEVIFVLRETESDNNNDWFNFSVRNPVVNTQVVELLESANLITDGIDRYTEPLESNVLNTLNCRRYHTNVTDKHIYIMSFCDKPENSFQANGFLNFSAIDNANLQLKLRGTIPMSNLHVFALNWNFIKFEEGRLYVEYFV